MIASLSSAVTLGYRPRPLQQGSVPQIGVGAAEVDPAANQQQQPLQSVHDASVLSGLQTALHDEASPPLLVVAASVGPPESAAFDPLLLLEEPLLPLLLPELLLLPLLLPELLPLLLPELLPLLPPAASVFVEDPLSSLEEPVPLGLLLLQAASPTVDDAPMTTMTWKSFSIFMKHTLSPDG